MRKKGLTPGKMAKMMGVFSAAIFVLVVILYWKNQISFLGLMAFGFLSLLIGVFHVFGIRKVQMDGFLDGYTRAKDGFKKKKKK